MTHRHLRQRRYATSAIALALAAGSTSKMMADSSATKSAQAMSKRRDRQQLRHRRHLAVTSASMVVLGTKLGHVDNGIDKKQRTIQLGMAGYQSDQTMAVYGIQATISDHQALEHDRRKQQPPIDAQQRVSGKPVLTLIVSHDPPPALQLRQQQQRSVVASLLASTSSRHDPRRHAASAYQQGAQLSERIAA